MPKVSLVAQLITYIGRREYDAARRLVQVMIQAERSANRESAGRALEEALSRWPNVMTMKELPHQIQKLAWSDSSGKAMADIYLDDDLRAAVHRFVRERQHADKLREAGLPMRKTILMGGPPGNGKTSLASAIAGQLGIPFLSVKMHALVDSHLGETGRNIANLLEFAMMNECVVFLDEFDAIGSEREQSGESAGKENNRIVTTLLTNIDRLPDTSVLIAATNRQDAIDSALQRRFDLKLWLDHPSELRIAQYVEDYQQKRGVQFSRDVNEIAADLAGKPWSEVEQTCLDLQKEMILGESTDAEWIGKQESLAI